MIAAPRCRIRSRAAQLMAERVVSRLLFCALLPLHTMLAAVCALVDPSY